MLENLLQIISLRLNNDKLSAKIVRRALRWIFSIWSFRYWVLDCGAVLRTSRYSKISKIGLMHVLNICTNLFGGRMHERSL
jgi:hypothetical protein